MIRFAKVVLATALLVPALFAQDPAESAGTDAPPSAQEKSEPKRDILGVEDLARKLRRSLVVITHGNRAGETAGTGSGFVISEDGLIATCAHVIGESRPLTVRFDDGTEHEVTTIHAWDAKLDLAVLRIKAAGLDPLPLAAPGSLKQGSEVVAMGAPHGLEFSVVRGVVSALRDFDGRSLIQIAIPIEPGNSGGPLLDRAGRAHGLLTMKSAVTDNLGFAVPVEALHRLLEKPNSVPMENWLTIGKLDPKRWTTLMGARWTQRAGRISAAEPGEGFGGRSLCISAREVPEVPYEVAVEVRLDDESGAAGLIFASDGGDRHYGFYPSAGKLRLTRFDGPNVFSWTILDQVESGAYRPGEWNQIRVRVEDGKITGFVNGEKVVEREDAVLRGGVAGLAKFRDTTATFRRFRLGADLAPELITPKLRTRLERQITRLKREPENTKALSKLAARPELAGSLLKNEAEHLRSLATSLEAKAAALHRGAIASQIVTALQGDQNDRLLRAALLMAKLDNPEIDVEAYLEEVERMAGEIAASLPDPASEEDKVAAIRTYLFHDNGYHGSRTDYYSRSNSYLNEVIDDREGIPITLSLLVMELGRLTGVEIHGLGLPGHFVACYQKEGKREIIDPFEGALPMTEADANARLSAAGLEAKAAEFPVAQAAEIIRRMLNNLRAIAIEEQDFRAALGYVDVMLGLAPDDPQERLARALLHLQLGETLPAKVDLKWLLDHEPPDIHLDRVRELLERL